MNATYGQQVEFYPIPSADPDTLPDYLTGGGRFDFQTAELTKTTEDGQTAKLAIGDRVEFYVEVFDRNPAPDRPPGKSEARIKEVLKCQRSIVAAGPNAPGREPRSATWKRNNATCLIRSPIDRADGSKPAHGSKPSPWALIGRPPG